MVNENPAVAWTFVVYPEVMIAFEEVVKELKGK